MSIYPALQAAWGCPRRGRVDSMVIAESDPGYHAAGLESQWLIATTAGGI